MGRKELMEQLTAQAIESQSLADTTRARAASCPACGGQAVTQLSEVGVEFRHMLGHASVGNPNHMRADVVICDGCDYVMFFARNRENLAEWFG